MATILGSLLIHLGLESAEFTKGVDKADRDLKKATKSWEETGKSISNWGKGLTAGLTLPLVAAATAAVKGAQDQRQAMAQVEAALASMGNASGRTAEQLLKASDALELKSLYDGDQILTKVTANLLTFGKVSGDVFDRAQQAAIDLATRLGGDPQNAAIMLGKALNDPAKGITALTRVGVAFTEAQKKQIKAMTDAGNVAGAQGLILDELAKQYGGAAEAAANTDPMRQFAVVVGQIGDAVGEILLPFLTKAAQFATDLAARFRDVSPGMQSFIVGAGVLAAALGPVLMVIGAVTSGIAPLLAAISVFTPTLGAAGAATSVFGGFLSGLLPVLAPVAAAVAAAYLAWKNWDKIAPILSKVWEQINKALGPAVREMIDAISNALSSLWNGPFGAAVGQVLTTLGKLYAAYNETFGPVVLEAVASLARGIGSAFTTISNILNAVASLLKGDFRGAWEYAKAAAQAAVQTIGNVINAMVPGALQSIANLVKGVRDWIANKLAAIWQGALDKINTVKDAFFNLYDAVVGHSYVPDMVDGIARHIGRLEAEMVAPAKKATGKVAEAFRDLQEKTLGILERLFPEESQLLRLAQDEEVLNKALAKGVITARQYAEAMRKLNDERGKVTGSNWNADTAVAANDNPLDMTGIIAGLPDALDKIGKATKKTADETGIQTVRIAESFKDMVNQSMTAIRSLVDGIKKGDFLSILEGVLGVIMQLGGMGVFGKGVKARIDGARAMGGPVGGGRTYLVGERGPELFTPSRSGAIVPNHQLGGASRVEVIPSPYFNVVVDGRAQGVVGQAAPGIASATSSGMQSRMATQNMRRLA